MATDVMRLHIDTFVNDFSIDAGPEGEKALRSLLEAACAMENRPLPSRRLFWS
jgi:1,4-dihydroxy-6-naphthoate synthase